MSHRFKHAVPLAISVALLAFLWSELSLNFNLHWFTVADGVFGKFGLPEKFQLVLPATFVTWGLYYALGADRPAFRNTLKSAVPAYGRGGAAAKIVAALKSVPLAQLSTKRFHDIIPPR